jgi:hypothetical protein
VVLIERRVSSPKLPRFREIKLLTCVKIFFPISVKIYIYSVVLLILSCFFQSQLDPSRHLIPDPLYGIDAGGGVGGGSGGVGGGVGNEHTLHLDRDEGGQ